MFDFASMFGNGSNQIAPYEAPGGSTTSNAPNAAGQAGNWMSRPGDMFGQYLVGRLFGDKLQGSDFWMNMPGIRQGVFSGAQGKGFFEGMLGSPTGAGAEKNIIAQIFSALFGGGGA
jgi:hypothetical protein